MIQIILDFQEIRTKFYSTNSTLIRLLIYGWLINVAFEMHFLISVSVFPNLFSVVAPLYELQLCPPSLCLDRSIISSKSNLKDRI